MRASGHGRGKVILLGEHAVVYGHPALAGAIDRGVTATARAGRLGVEVAAWQLVVDADPPPGDEAAAAHPVARALRTIADAIAAHAVPRRAVTADDTLLGDPMLDRLPVRLIADATVPAGAGLGSSAALAVACTRALAHASDVVLADDEVVDIANAAEAEFHHRPSGIDVALAARGGLGLFERDVGLRRIAAAPLPIVVGLTGATRRTADMVQCVAAATGQRADDARLVELGAAARTGARAIVDGDVAQLGALMTSAHHTLASLGVSTAALDALVAAALAAGALGAKLTGAGGGGAVVALAPGREAAVQAAWRDLAVDTFTTVVGSPA